MSVLAVRVAASAVNMWSCYDVSMYMKSALRIVSYRCRDDTSKLKNAATLSVAFGKRATFDISSPEGRQEAFIYINTVGIQSVQPLVLVPPARRRRFEHLRLVGLTFKMQVEQSNFAKIADKEVGWNFSDQEEAAIIDMRLGMEKNFIFGSRAKLFDPDKNEHVYFTGGIWGQTDRSFELPVEGPHRKSPCAPLPCRVYRQ